MTSLTDKRTALDNVISLMEKHSTNKRVTVDMTEAELKKFAKQYDGVWRYRNFELVRAK